MIGGIIAVIAAVTILSVMGAALNNQQFHIFMRHIRAREPDV